MRRCFINGLLALLSVALATSTFAWVPHGGSATGAFGPGSPGFLSTCSSTFAIENEILQSQSFTTSPWATSAAVVSAPTITPNSTTAPDSTTTASTLTLPAVTGTGARSVLSQAQTTVFNNYTYTGDIYVRGSIGGETLWLIINNNGTLQSTKIVATTAWQRISKVWHATSNSQTFSIGVDLADLAETPTSAETVYIWGSQIIRLGSEFAYIPTTTAPVLQNQVVNCPPGVAFRDFSTLTAYSGNPIIPQNTASYNAGGTSGPYMRSWGQIAGVFYGLASCTPVSPNRNWQNQCLYTAPVATPLVWTLNASNPAISGTPGNWDDHYLLHGAPSPTCSVAAWCYYYSAEDASNVSSIGLATSSDLIHWTKYGTTPLVTTITFVNQPCLPTIIQIGSTLYMYVALGENGTTYLGYWTSPVSDGINWSFVGISLNSAASTDWDAGGSVLDPQVQQNSHGFYEMEYTALVGGASQQIGYAVSKDGNLWFKYGAGPIVSAGTPADPSSPPIGDTVIYQDATNYYWFGNYDDGSSSSAGIAAIMPAY
jgi:hypothetical protein